MKAMIFAAGLGTRLKPLTDNTPKALIEVNGITLLEHAIRKLIENNVTEIIVNIHYLGQQIIDFLTEKKNFGIRIEISDERNELLDSGGGLKKASWFFNDDKPFILYNVDILSNININDMLQYHINSNSQVTLAVRQRKSSRYLLFNNELNLCGWKNIKTSEEIISKTVSNPKQLAFSGIHILNPEIFNCLNQSGKFSIINFYLDISKIHFIKAYEHNADYWFDIGDINKLDEAKKFLNS